MCFLENCCSVKKIFLSCHTAEEHYQKIIALGNELPPLDPKYKCKENLVTGCQSQLYLYAEYRAPYLYFKADSDALISKGLASLLLKLYSGESPFTLLESPLPLFQELHLLDSLSPSRSNGMSSLYLKMKLEALLIIAKYNLVPPQ